MLLCLMLSHQTWSGSAEIAPAPVRVEGVDLHGQCAAVPHPVQESGDGRSVEDGSQCFFERFMAVGRRSTYSRRRSKSQQPLGFMREVGRRATDERKHVLVICVLNFVRLPRDQERGALRQYTPTAFPNILR